MWEKNIVESITVDAVMVMVMKIKRLEIMQVLEVGGC